MDRDTLILIAFGIFLLLVGIRLKQRLADSRGQDKPMNANSSQEGQTPQSGIARGNQGYRRRLWGIIQLIVVGGLLVYMLVVLIRDFRSPVPLEMKEIFLRCLIFVVSIYIFILGWFRVFRR